MNPAGKDKEKHPYAWITFKDNKGHMESFPEDGKYDTTSLTYVASASTTAAKITPAIDPKAPDRQMPIPEDLPFDKFYEGSDLFGDDGPIDRQG